MAEPMVIENKGTKYEFTGSRDVWERHQRGELSFWERAAMLGKLKPYVAPVIPPAITQPTPPAPAPTISAPTAPAVDATREAAKNAKGKQSTLLSQVAPPSRARTRGRQKTAMQRSQIGLSSTTKQTLLGTA